MESIHSFRANSVGGSRLARETMRLMLELFEGKEDSRAGEEIEISVETKSEKDIARMGLGGYDQCRSVQ